MTLSVTVYSKPDCRQCTATKKKLDQLGVPYEEAEITPEDLAAAIELGVGSAPIVAITLPDGSHDQWGGFKPDRLNALKEHIS